jgi:peptide/nickel transport system substrate-binding protein
MQHDRFNELLLAARSELDTNKRREHYHEMQEILYDRGGAVVPVFSSYVLAMSDKLGHASKISSSFDLDAFRVARNFWFES